MRAKNTFVGISLVSHLSGEEFKIDGTKST